MQEANEEYVAALNRASMCIFSLNSSKFVPNHIFPLEDLHAQVSEVLREMLDEPELPS